MGRKQTGLTWTEGRRARAWELHQKGWTNSRIAEALGVTEPAVSQWLKSARTHGAAALRSKHRQGQGARLSRTQLQSIPELLERGPLAYGFDGEFWTCRRIAVVVARTFNVRYHPDHVRKLLHALHWSFQTPVVQASQRDEVAIAAWLTYTWPAIKKKAQDEGRTIVFVDETAFYLCPTVTKTWSPEGQTPVLRAPKSRAHLSVIGGVTLDGSLFAQIQAMSFRTKGVIEFLRHLLFYIPGNILIVWNNVRIHKSKELSEFLKMDTVSRMTFEHFPPYAPELDPQKYVWRHLKHVDLRNLTPHSLDDLWAHVRSATQRLRHRVGILQQLAQHAGLL
jgi:transposase